MANASPHQSVALLNAIVESLPFRVWACNPAGQVFLQNSVSLRDFGNCVGNSAAELPLPPVLLGPWLENAARAQGGEVVWDEAAMTIQGVQRTFRYVLAPIRDGDAPRGIVGVDIDVTDLRHAQAALKESEERLRSIMESAPDMMLQVSVEGTITYINYVEPPVRKSDVLGTKAEDWVPERFRPLVREALESVYARGKQFHFETQSIGPNLHDSWYSVLTSPVTVGGKVVAAVMVARNITDQRQAAEALRESESLYRLLAENSYDVISRHGPTGTWIYVSPASRGLLGYEPEELLGRDPFDFIHPEDGGRVQMALAELVATQQVRSATFRIRRKDGRYIWSETHGRAILDPRTGEVLEVVATSRDVTARIEATQKLREREAEFAHADRLSTMGQMASEIAHELNQPLYAISNFADACLGLVARQPASDPNLQRWLEMIAGQARRAGDVVRRITEFVRKGELDAVAVNLNDAISDALTLLDFELSRRSIELSLDLDPALPSIQADRLLIEQVLVNLVRNAIEAITASNRQPRKLTLRTFVDSDGVRTQVSDTGAGLPPEEMEHLFEPYFTTKAGGTGMGLAICRSTIEAHNGRIWAQNLPEGGARFEFILPLRPAQSA